MKQVVQNYRTGELCVEQVPAPICRPGTVLVRTAYSLVSSGTERMKVSQARMSLIQKARARPDKVRQVLDNVRRSGLVETARKVSERLDALTPLGYSLAGVVEEVGAGIDDLAVGDRVACAGEGIACHAEFVTVPRNLCAPVPDGVDLKDAAFATVGAIAINGVRQAGVSLGDSVLVVGLGLVGLLAVQLLKAAGCRVIGVDLDPRNVELAKKCGADAALTRDDASLGATVESLAGADGVDAVYIAASTQSTDPMQLAGKLLRDRGRVVIVGMVPVEADWKTFYEKELTVLMSRSYGPGRYDRNYEHKGIDYPIGYVRWTEQRNLEEFLRLIGASAVNPSRLSPTEFAIEDATEAYRELHEDGRRFAGGLLFRYSSDATRTQRTPTTRPRIAIRRVSGTIGVGMVGAGHFATATLIPALKRIPDVHLRSICSAGGLTARSAARRHGFECCSSDFDELVADPSVQAVVIATRHDTHATLAARALRAGKHVFVEKPLALTPVQLAELSAAYHESSAVLMPGFNRRFSPLAIELRDHFAPQSGPIEVLCRVNAGALSHDSWYRDTDEGGWRIISEGCHFVDLVQFLCGCRATRVFAQMIGGHVAGRQNDNCSVILKMENGSVATIVYVANGDPSAGKERIEVFGQGRTGLIDDWRWAHLSGKGRARKVRASSGGKGHREEIAAFIAAATGQIAPPIAFADAVACTMTTFAIGASLVSQAPEPVKVDE